MKVNYEISPEFSFLKEELLNIPALFESCGEIVFKERNLIKKLTVQGGYTLNVKRFKRPNFINKIIYGRFRKTKAFRSYQVAQELVVRGIGTPAPVAYIEYYHQLQLDYSYYISIHIDADYTFRDFLDGGNPPNSTYLIQQYTKFSIEIQKKGIWNPDNSPGNTLFVLQPNNAPKFYLVDLNRIQFKTVSISEGINNFDRLWAPDNRLEIIGRTYAQEFQLNEHDVIKQMIDRNNKWKEKRRLKRRIKSILLFRKYMDPDKNLHPTNKIE